jgi:hypothetical protein
VRYEIVNIAAGVLNFIKRMVCGQRAIRESPEKGGFSLLQVEPWPDLNGSVHPTQKLMLKRRGLVLEKSATQ